MPAPAKKTAPAAASKPQPAPEPAPVPSATPDAQPPAEPVAPSADQPPTDAELEAAETEGDDFCPTPGECFPDGVPEAVVALSCVHGHWDLAETVE